MRKLVSVLLLAVTFVVSIVYNMRCEFNSNTVSHHWSKHFWIFSMTGQLYPELDMLSIVETMAYVNARPIIATSKIKRNARYYTMK